MNSYLLVAKQAALLAGEVLINGFRSNFSISSKDYSHNLVTEFDLKSEKIIIDHILKNFPDHAILSEESGRNTSTSSEIQWIIDPLDGTVNFAHGIPLFCVSIAAVSHGKPICGVIYAPMTDELFTVESGHGAFLNGNQIHVSKTQLLQDAILVTGFPYNVRENPLNCIGHFSQFVSMGLPIRRLGSAAIDLAYIASGRFDGFWEVELQPWDMAAGILLVQEAGGSVIDYQGNPINCMQSGTIIASNSFLEFSILAQINKANVNFPKRTTIEF